MWTAWSLRDARTECLAQIFGPHVHDGREVSRCLGPKCASDGHFARISFSDSSVSFAIVLMTI